MIYTKHIGRLIPSWTRARWLNKLGSWITLRLIQTYYQYGVGFAPGFVNSKKGELESQPQAIKFTSYLPMIGGSLRVLLLLPPLTLVAMI